MEGNIDSERILRLRGFPYSATEADFVRFFEPVKFCNIIFPVTTGKRPQGECYVIFKNKEDAEESLMKHKNTIGRRYVEIFRTNDYEVKNMENNNRACEAKMNKGRYSLNNIKNCVKLRGLPFSVTENDIKNFFSGLKVLEIIIEKDPANGGRLTGEGMVSFSSDEDVTAALRRDKQSMGSRYIEIFRGNFPQFILMKEANSMVESMQQQRGLGKVPYNNHINNCRQYYERNSYFYPPTCQRRGGEPPFFCGPYIRPMEGPSYFKYNKDTYFPARDCCSYYPYNGYSKTNSFFNTSYNLSIPMPQSLNNEYNNESGGIMNEYRLQLRGIPFKVNYKDIREFFKPIHIESISMGYFNDGRLTGDCIVEFRDHKSVVEAKKKNGLNMGSRYIEIFDHENARLTKRARYEVLPNNNSPDVDDEYFKKHQEAKYEQIKQEVMQSPMKPSVKASLKRRYPGEVDSLKHFACYRAPFNPYNIPTFAYQNKSPDNYFGKEKKTKYF
uniref:RRM domain-containing protein n=1 Tax=Parastrongyloides trichosuri TaxID=131310 RepID=A0A0N4ZPB8_PARTI